MPVSLLDFETSASVVSLIVGSEVVTGGTRHLPKRVSALASAGTSSSSSITVSEMLAFARLLFPPFPPLP